MRNYIILNGKNSNEINGLLIQELPPISKPLIRTEVEEIDGRDGDIVTPLGYSAYDKEFTIGLYKDFDVNEVAAYFNSEGTVIFSNEPDKYYYYQITAQIDFERLVRYRTATVTMHCQPFKYSATEQPITEDVSGTVSDEGTNLALENTAEAPFNTLDLKGNTSQQTYSGKNLLRPYSGLGTITPNGLSVTLNRDGSLTISGTANAETYIEFGYQFYGATQRQDNALYNIDSASTYRLSATYSGTITGGSYLPRVYAQIKSDYTEVSSALNSSATITGSNGIYRSWIRIYNGTSFTNAIIYPQLELGNTATAWQPYVGGIPAPNPDYPQAVQTVTGENVVKINGKNLLKYPYKDTTVTRNGVTFTDNGDGTITANGTATADSLFWLTNDTWAYSANNVIIPAGTYTISKTGQSYATMYVTAYGKTQGQIGTFSVSTSDATFTTTEETSLTVRLKIGSGTTVSGFVFCPQIEKGAATDYEPYQGQSYEINLGKNLFDKDNASEVINAYIDTSAHKITTGNNQRLAYIECEPNTTYTISKTLSARFIIATTSDTPANNVSVSQDIAKNTDTTYTITTNSTAKYLCVFCYHASYDTSTPEQILSTLQIEKGSTATSYAPYFTPIELCKIGTYQDYIWKDGDTWKVHKAIGKYVYNNDLTQNGISSGVVAMITPTLNIAPNLADNIGTFYSNMLTPTVVSNTGIKGTTSVSKIRVQISTSYADSYDGFKALAAANNLTIYFPLATTTDTEITDSELIEQLEALAEARSYKVRTHINSSAATGNVPHIIAAEVGEDNESTITNAGNYLSKPKITVYGSGDISLYINDMHVLQITLGDEGYITIDTAQMEAYKDTLDNLKNRLVIGDYSNARLKPGANKIHFTGTVTKYIVENYSRWL